MGPWDPSTVPLDVLSGTWSCFCHPPPPGPSTQWEVCAHTNTLHISLLTSPQWPHIRNSHGSAEIQHATTSCTLPIAQITLAFYPCSLILESAWVECTWETVAVLQARGSPASVWISSPLARAWLSAQFPMGFPSFACPCLLVTCTSTRT